MSFFSEMFEKNSSKKEEKKFNSCGEDADKEKFKVLIINDDETTISGCLGITDERSEEINKACLKAFEDNDTVTEAMVQLSKMIKHANEFAYGFSILGHLHSKNAMMASMGKSGPSPEAIKSLIELRELLKRLKRDQDEE